MVFIFVVQNFQIFFQNKNIILWIFDIMNPNPVYIMRDNKKMVVINYVHTIPVQRYYVFQY